MNQLNLCKTVGNYHYYYFISNLKKIAKLPHDSTLIMNDWFCWCWMNLKFYSQFHPRSRRNPNRGSVLHRQQTSSAFQTGNWREAVPQSCPLHLLWQRNLAHSEWPTDSPDPDTYNLKKHTKTQRTFWIKSSRHDYHKKLLWVVIPEG